MRPQSAIVSSASIENCADPLLGREDIDLTIGEDIRASVESAPVQEASPIEMLGGHVKPLSPDRGGQAWSVGFMSHLHW